MGRAAGAYVSTVSQPPGAQHNAVSTVSVGSKARMDEAHGTVSTATVTEHLVSTELAMLAGKVHNANRACVMFYASWDRKRND